MWAAMRMGGLSGITLNGEFVEMSNLERAMRTIARWERELNKIVPETVGDAVDLDMHRDDLEHLPPHPPPQPERSG